MRLLSDMGPPLVSDLPKMGQKNTPAASSYRWNWRAMYMKFCVSDAACPPSDYLTIGWQFPWSPLKNGSTTPLLVVGYSSSPCTHPHTQASETLSFRGFFMLCWPQKSPYVDISLYHIGHKLQQLYFAPCRLNIYAELPEKMAKKYNKSTWQRTRMVISLE